MLSTGTAVAQESSEDLRKEIEVLVARNAWSGADRAYTTLIEDKVKLDPTDHFRGARAAMALGNINDTVERLERADGHEEARTLLAEILAAYGEVKLAVPGSHSGGVPLRPAGPMVDATHRAVLEAAKDALQETGKYKGLLPVGTYKLGATPFDVIVGSTTKAKLS